MYKKTELNNGIRVITHQMPSMQSVALGIWLKAGGRYETAGDKGVSHYLEHLLFKGSKKYSCRAIKESIEGLGGALNGFTSEEFTCYLAKLPAEHLGTALDILSDMVINPLLSKQDVAKEKTVILEEIKMYKDLPQSYVHELLDELLWPRQPLGMSVLGSAESVGRIDQRALLAYKNAQYTSSNIIVSAAGKLDHEKFTRKVKALFSGLKKEEGSSFLKAQELQDAPQVKIFPKGTEQTHLAMGFHSFKREHPLKHAVALLHIILGANMSSRLFEEVREKRGLAYEIGTQVKRFSDTGAFIVHAGIDNNKVVDALALILKELKRTKVSEVTRDELKRAKDFYLGQLMLALEDTMDHMLWIGESTAALDKTLSLKDIMREVQKVTQEDIRRACKEIFNTRRLNIALIGPVENKAQLIRSAATC